MVVIPIETTNLLRFFRTLQLSADVAILRTVAGLDAQPTIGPELPLATRASSLTQSREYTVKAVGTKDEGKPVVGQASSEIPALKPYWGKPAIRNFRGGNGNVGIIRSPVRAIALPDYEKGVAIRSASSLALLPRGTQ